MPERGPVGFGRREAAGRGGRHEPRRRPVPGRGHQARRRHRAALIPERPARGHKGSFGKLLVIAGSLDYAGRGAPRLPRGRPDRRRPRHAGRPGIAPAAVRGQGRRGDDDGAARRTTSRRSTRSRRSPASSTTSTTRSSSGPASARASRRPSSSARCWRWRARPTRSTRRRSCSTPRRSGRWRRWTLVGGRPAAGRPDPARRRVRAAAGGQRRAASSTTATSPTTTRRGWRPRSSAAATWRLGRRPQGRPDGHRGARTARPRSPRSRTRPSRPAAPATSWPARSARSSPRVSPRSTPARLGVYLHGLAGDAGPRAVRRRRPARLGPARRHRDRPQAPGRHRRAPKRAAKRLGFGAVAPGDVR